MLDLNVKKETFELRLSHWEQLIAAKNASGLTARQWLEENNIPRNQYYYWLRRVRRKVLIENNDVGMVELLPKKDGSLNTENVLSTADVQNVPTLPITEEKLNLHIGSMMLEIPNHISRDFLRMVIQEVRDAQ